MIPKAGGAGDVHLVATLLDQIEEADGLEHQIGLSVLIETAMGMVHADEIADGVSGADGGDGVRRGGLRRVDAEPHDVDRRGQSGLCRADGRERERPGEPLGRSVALRAVPDRRGCRAHGLRPIDGPFGDFNDPEGYLAAARRAAVLGYEGKWAIHPSQIELANDVFTPDDHIVEKTHKIIEAMERAVRGGQGRRVASTAG